jgi:hypothetical protein
MICVLVAIFCASSQAAPVSSQQARTAAESFLVKRFPAAPSAKVQTRTLVGSSVMGIQGVGPLEVDKTLAGYVIQLAPQGYILLSTDDQAPPVKLYSDNGAFDALPPDFRAVIETEMLEDLANLSLAKTVVAASTSSTSQYSNQWNELLYPSVVNGAMAEASAGVAGVTLLTTTWDQGTPYNLYCPVAGGGPGGRAWAGCSATALAQVLRYHQKPLNVKLDHTYTDSSGSCTGTWSISDVGMTAYDWTNMPASISNASPLIQQQAVAKLIYHCAVALESDFEAGGTGAYPSIVPDVLGTYFGYTSAAYVSKASYTSVAWYNMIAADIDVNLPVFYAMWTASGGSGHAVVCDGYRNGNEMHLNLGWSGSYNAWYNVDSVSAGGYTWTQHGAVFDIVPPVNGIVTIGNGANTWDSPLRAYYRAARTQTIYLAGEIGPARTITKLALDVETTPGQTLNYFTIRMKHTTMGAYSSPSWDSSDWTTVYQANQTISTTGWTQFDFTTPFNYNGTDNVLVDISFNDSSGTASGYCYYSTPGGTRSIYRSANSGSDPLTWSGASPSPSTSSNVLNIKLTVNPQGDANRDLKVDFHDYAMVAAGWGMTGCSAANQWCSGADIDLSGDVNTLDLAAVASHWLEGVTP